MLAWFLKHLLFQQFRTDVPGFNPDIPTVTPESSPVLPGEHRRPECHSFNLLLVLSFTRLISPESWFSWRFLPEVLTFNRGVPTFTPESS